MTRELKKIEKIECDLGSEKSKSAFDPSRHELIKKREEILQKFTQIHQAFPDKDKPTPIASPNATDLSNLNPSI